MRVWITVGVLLVASVLAACATTYGTHGEDLNKAAAAMIRRGMSQSDVRGILGRPTRITHMGEGRELWTYRYYRIQVEGKVVCRPLPPPDKDVIHPSHGGIYVVFDSKGKVAMVQRG